MPDSPVLVAVARNRALLERTDSAAMRRLVAAYARMQTRLTGQIDALLMAIEAGPASLPETDLGRVTRLTRYRDLLSQIEAETAQIAGLLRTESDTLADNAIGLGERHARELLGLSAGDIGLASQFNRLPKATIETLLGFLAPDSPLYERIASLSSWQAQRVADAITTGVGLGYNSRKIAASIESAFGEGLTTALRTVRTVQNWSYREASRATYIANGDILEGWIWHAKLDSGTCMSCIAQHGTLHPLDEPLNDHYNGRCAAIPKVIGFPNPVEQTGEEWFNKLTPAQQQEFMGKGRFEAWQAGKFEFNRLTQERRDEVYGLMKSVTPLKELLDN